MEKTNDFIHYAFIVLTNFFQQNLTFLTPQKTSWDPARKLLKTSPRKKFFEKTSPRNPARRPTRSPIWDSKRVG